MLKTRHQYCIRSPFFGLGLLAVLAAATPRAFAQSIDELEAQVLSGASPTSSSDAPAPARREREERAEETSTVDPEARVSTEVLVPEDKRDDVEEELKTVDQDVKGPDRIPLEHILVVQYRFIRKEGTHEVTPFFAGIQPADSFRRQMPWGFSYAYHFSEDFGVEAVNATFLKNFGTGLSDAVKDEYNLFTERKEPVFSLGSALLWTPLKSKAATREEIHYFEGYFLAGGGLTRYEHSMVGMGMVGLGFRAYMTQRTLFKAELRDNFDFVSGSPTQRLNVLFGVALLLGGEG